MGNQIVENYPRFTVYFLILPGVLGAFSSRLHYLETQLTFSFIGFHQRSSPNEHLMCSLPNERTAAALFMDGKIGKVSPGVLNFVD
jgi:hypothetical protein